ncbi:uncharacterized protein TNIN_3571 [Trichonephila inaurata madagascariensis]|uniref:Uncharacterized protein n=1 Tax=Trichonephila inaurata madagascariensis TaxID=2747483 RepID=A0A8X6WQR2_9ARAC|nr:uncharacterized protein TNIN_3571 [Trichonephila inaurata madagascariensis]
MKRSHEEEEDEPSAKLPKSDLITNSDKNLLNEIKHNLESEGDRINEQLTKTRQQYYMSYMKKVMEKIPMSRNIMGSITNIPEGYEGFLKMFSIAKTMVHSEIQLKKIRAFNSIFDMANGLVGKLIHDRYIAPHLNEIINPDQLQKAF